MFANLLRGTVAGAAGTTALNAVTYLDMAVRARPASDTPQRAVEAIARRVGRPVPGAGEERTNRLGGLGPLSGILTGVGVGVLAGLLRPLVVRMPASLASLLIGTAAMAASDVPLSVLGLTDPTSWSTQQWAADVVPHLAFGVATVATLRMCPSQR